ncbi:MAG: DUF2961 domain-containing protein [Parvibaculum sp.]|nr:DUF2961 domain-containing protein [Parvibaculum sp.]
MSRGTYWPGSSPVYDIHSELESRAISFENPTGARGAGGRVASPLGVGRKGDPARLIMSGETVELAHIAGSGTIRHIWLTTLPSPEIFRGLVLRVWWDGQAHPSIESPIGDFFGFAHGVTPAFESEIHSVGELYGVNIWLPMPFAAAARFTLTNDLPSPVPVFYQIDYTLGDRHDDDVGRLHVLFQRANPTTLTQDFELLPKRQGAGRYVGTVIGVRPLGSGWWGEGEVKIYLDGDTDFPTISGTGAEDYAGISFGIQPTPFRFHGANYREGDESTQTGRISMYRWHLPDPVFWKSDIRVTIQQIGLAEGAPPASIEDYKAKLVERRDDWSAATFWYEAVPSAPLPPLPDLAARIADLPASR